MKKIIALCLLALLLSLSALYSGVAEEAVTVAISAGVTVEGCAVAEGYTLRLTAGDETCPMPEGKSGGSYDLILKGAGAATFPAMRFDRPGSYTYTISQQAGNHALAVGYDSNVYDLRVQVRQADGELKLAAVMNRRGSEKKSASADFVNAYVAPAVTQQDPPVRKRVTGDTPAAPATFHFTLTAVSNTAGLSAMPMPEGATGGVKNLAVQAGKEQEFGAMRFDAPGTYVYRVVEANDNQTGYGYDGSVYTLTYTVARNGDALQAERTIQKDGAPVSEAVFEFVNTYKASSTSSSGGSKSPGVPAEPTADVTGKVVWVDDGNAHGVRPGGVTLQLYANGRLVQDAAITWTGRVGDTWTFTFAGQPERDAQGNPIVYTVREDAVPYYQTSVSGTTVTNRLEQRQPTGYVVISGVKTWKDDGAGRPGYITVRLLRDGGEIAQRIVTAASEWAYSFGEQPRDDGYGHSYAYAVREDAVSGYFARYSGYDVINTPFGAAASDAEEKGDPKTPGSRFASLTEEELEDLMEAFQRSVPLWGSLLSTGDETPPWVYAAAATGALALLGFVLLGRKRRRKA